MTVWRFLNTCDILGESETTGDALSIFLCLKNVIENNLGLNLEELIGFCSDGASAMTGKDNGVAARIKQLEECSGILSVHCICHHLALACGDTEDDLKFISDFETTVIQLWISQTSQNVYGQSLILHQMLTLQKSWKTIFFNKFQNISDKERKVFSGIFHKGL